MSDMLPVLLGLLQGLGLSTVFLLAVFLGFCVLVGLTKLRPIDKRSRVVRSLDDRLGPGARYLPPSVPRGPADQLKTPELLEQSTASQE